MAILTNKNIEFLSNPDLIAILGLILEELDVVASGGAHRSTTYLAVSALEGLFNEILKLLRIAPTAGSVPTGWPLKSNGKPKSASKLTLEDVHNTLRAHGALSSDFDQLYGPLRQFRNYMHPKLELRDSKPISQSVALRALAALNALIEDYQFRRFVALQEWTLVHGRAQVMTDDAIDMSQSYGEQVSLLVSEEPARHYKKIKLAVFVQPGAIFNFVYNYSSRDKFMAARVDGRADQNGHGLDNGRLVCNKWQAWSIIDRYMGSSDPDPRSLLPNL